MKRITHTNRRATSFWLIIGLLFCTGLAVLPLVRAADFTAANEAELADAIAAANAAGLGDHTIALTADINLTAPLPAFDNTAANGIQLDGDGHTLDANGTGTALAILANTTVTIQDLTITGGDGNRGTNSQSAGGVFNAGDLTIIDTIITGNTAADGGGILNLAAEQGVVSLTLTRVTLSDNTATSTGGGLASHGDTGTITVTMTDSSVTGNSATQYGGGIANNGHSGSVSLTIHNSTIDGNDSFLGAGIFNNGNSGQATLALTRSTVSGNDAGDSGGGIFNNGNLGTATVTLTNSTVSGNSALKSGGGLTSTANQGTAEITFHYTTIANNNAKTGSGLYNSTNAVAEAAATLFVAGTPGKACAFNGGTTITSDGYNLDTDGSCGLTGTGDISSGQPALQALALNAPGTTATHATGDGSAAVDKVPTGAAGCGDSITTDQRGASRPAGGTLCDIGAYETGGSQPPTSSPTPTVIVTGTPPTPTATPTASTTPPPVDCNPPYNPATEFALNGAIQCVNQAGSGTHLITLAGDITLSAPTTPIDNPDAEEIVIDGDGHKIDGNYKGTILSVATGTTVRVRDISLVNGQGSSGPSSNWGGGIYNRGELTVETSTLSGNLAQRGGAIANHGQGAPASLTVLRSTLSGNAALATGGGILNVGGPDGSANVVVENATLSGNVATAGGGGLFNGGEGGNAIAAIRYATVALNTATSGGSGLHTTTAGGTSVISLLASIVTNGTSPSPDCALTGGNILSGGYNIAGDNTCNLTNGSDQPAADPKLLPLALNVPGTTATFALGAASPALNKIPAGTAGCGTTVATDQRGANRPMPAGDICDIGAYERQTKEPETTNYRLYLAFVADQQQGN